MGGVQRVGAASGRVRGSGRSEFGRRFGPRFRTRRHCFRQSRGVRGSAWCDLGRLLGHVLGRGARHTPVLQCQIQRRGGASRRLFWHVEKATLRCCIAKYVTPADGGQKHAPLLLWSSHAKSPKIAIMIDYYWGGGSDQSGRSPVSVKCHRRVNGQVSKGQVSGVIWSTVIGH